LKTYVLDDVPSVPKQNKRKGRKLLDKKEKKEKFQTEFQILAAKQLSNLCSHMKALRDWRVLRRKS